MSGRTLRQFVELAKPEAPAFAVALTGVAVVGSTSRLE